MKKWAGPAYIRGFDSFEPPMSRFCLWKAASFTRFWSLSGLKGSAMYEVLISSWGFTRFWSLLSPAEGHLRGQCHSGSLFTRFWSRFGDSARRWEIQTSWIRSLHPASREIKTSCIKPPDLVVLKIKTSYIAARLSVGGEIKTLYIHYIYSIYIVFPDFVIASPKNPHQIV